MKLQKTLFFISTLATLSFCATPYFGYEIYNVNINSLNKRLGDLRFNPSNNGVWGRIFSGKESNALSKTNMYSRYTTIQAGYDRSFGSIGANNFFGVGFAFGRLDSSNKKDIAGDMFMDSKNVEIAFYNTYAKDNGLYTDSILKFAYMSNEFDIQYDLQKYLGEHFGASLGQEVGYRFKLWEVFYLEPQLQAVAGYVSGSDIDYSSSSSKRKFLIDSLFSLRTRGGLSGGYIFVNSQGLRSDFKITGSYVYDFAKGESISNSNIANRDIFSAVGNDGRFVLNVGTNVELNEDVSFYFDVEKSFAGKVNTEYLINLGFRYNFGKGTYLKSNMNKESTTQTTPTPAPQDEIIENP